MRRLSRFLFVPLVLVAAVALPGTALAGGASFRTHVLRNYCYGENGWANFFKASETVSGLTTANRLTIDSRAQIVQLVANDLWQTVQTWPRLTHSFIADGTDHSLTLKRTFAGGGPEQVGRIVFKMKSWHNSTLLWSRTLYSRQC